MKRKCEEYSFRVRLSAELEKPVLDRLKELHAIGDNSEFLRNQIMKQAQRSLPLAEFIEFYPHEAKKIISEKNPHLSDAQLDKALSDFCSVEKTNEP